MAIPDSKKIYPRDGDNTIVYLKNVIKSPNIEVGDFTFYNQNDAFKTRPYVVSEHNVAFVVPGLVCPYAVRPFVVKYRKGVGASP